MRPYSAGRLILVPALAIALTGCASYGSQLVNRDNDGRKWEGKKLEGVPVRISVPTHLEVQIVLSQYIDDNGQQIEVRNPDGTIQKGVYLTSQVVRHKLHNSDRVFTVDPQRPGAGTAHPQLAFNDDYYLTSLKNSISDTTIEQTSTLISTLAQAGGLRSVFVGSSTSAGDDEEKTETPAPEPKSLASIDFVEAQTILEIDDPMFAHKLEAFMNTHVNCP